MKYDTIGSSFFNTQKRLRDSSSYTLLNQKAAWLVQASAQTCSRFASN